MSIDGTLLTRGFKAGLLKDIVVVRSTRRQFAESLVYGAR
jgi:hypothetical protein